MDLKISEMMEFQQQLQALHPEWGGLQPGRAKEQMLWSIAELGEAIQILKKLGEERLMTDEKIRTEFAEEIGDVMMYLWDTLLCLGMDAETFSKIYTAKCMHNQKRDYVQEHADRYGV